MNIAILHYHLKPGGVTTVIKQQINALKNDCEILLLTGAPTEDNFQVDTAVINGIGYDQTTDVSSAPESIAESIIDSIFSKWESGCDILHVHNPLLAKNKNFLKILSLLQNKNIRLFLQVHDFAEDGRPWSYYLEDEYPGNCHYGVINSRDYGIMLKSGIKKQGLHQIFNMVNPFNLLPEKTIDKEIILYPVRAIRRKKYRRSYFAVSFF